ncbi:hypothetical protein JCM19302_3017 [Jejuia pallidilutea]|uniref:Uncharacterized protein n=1 Tax=Jejuia pallidilutea TaxID=504487 RepID=A0A090WUJ6_9FLAO|nr:hypothetical protein JCM19302_3017 [Jejuia pallidilutea]
MLEALWGDRVEIVSNTQANGRYKVNVRWAKNVYIKAEDLGDEPLLELYFIDVGQGDGVLIVTPERKHILIDGATNALNNRMVKVQPILWIGSFLRNTKKRI